MGRGGRRRHRMEPASEANGFFDCSNMLSISEAVMEYGLEVICFLVRIGEARFPMGRQHSIV